VLHLDGAVQRMARHVVAQPRRAILGHDQVERLVQLGRLVGMDAERGARAHVDDPVHAVLAVEVGEVQRHVGDEPRQQVEHGARRVREGAVGGRRGGGRGLDRAGVHCLHHRT
jgi:hypothetical protein